MAKYIDICIQPLPIKNLPHYKKATVQIGKLLLKHGALASYDYVADDDNAKSLTKSFAKSVKIKKGEVIIVALAEFKSKAHRDQVFKKMMADSKMEKIMNPETPYMDYKRMIVGGFKNFVSLKK